jgi:hypothetical protein
VDGIDALLSLIVECNMSDKKPIERDKCDLCKRYFPVSLLEFSNSRSYYTCICMQVAKLPHACLRCTLPTEHGWTHGHAETCVVLLLEWIRDALAERNKFLTETRDKICVLIEKRKAG